MRKAITNSMFWAVFVSLALAVGIANADVEEGLVGHWTFDEGEGTTAEDSSGNENHGTLIGDPQWAPGHLRGALEFDGIDDYAELPIGSLISSLTNSTFATWVDFSNQGGAWQRIFDFGTGTTFYMFLTPRIGTSEPMRFAITISAGGAGEQMATAPSTLPSGWHHVAVTIDADNDTSSLYLDGSVVAENTAATLAPSDLGDTTQNWLGRSQYSADAYLDGSLDDFRIYNRALSEEDIVELMEWTGGAYAGPDQWVEAGDTVTLEGSGPADATSFSWEQVIIADEPVVTLVNPNNATCTFDSQARDIGYVLTFRLTVDSTTVGTTTDECIVTARAPNPPKIGPGNLRMQRIDRGFWLFWDSVVDAENYDVEVEVPGGGWWPIGMNIRTLEYPVTDREPGEEITVRVVPKNKRGSGTPSATFVITIMRNVALPESLLGVYEPSEYVNIFDNVDVPGMNNKEYDDSTDSWEADTKTEDYAGYLWDQNLYFDEIVYFTGEFYWDGGWFTDLKVQYTQDAGATWIDVPGVVIYPPYDFSDRQGEREDFTRYDMSFMALYGNGIRIFGTPGGYATFTSIAELEVYGNQLRPILIVQGVDNEFPERTTATLDGSFCISTRGPITSYLWTQESGPAVVIADVTAAVTSFEASGVDADTLFVFSLKAGDGVEELTDEDVRILIRNVPTTAVAGPDQRVYESTLVTLDGTGSLSTSEDILYTWTQAPGTPVTLTGANTAAPSFTAPTLWGESEDLVFTLKVEDGVGGESTDTVTVAVHNSLFFIAARVGEGDLPDDPWAFTVEDIPSSITAGDTTYDAATETYTVTADGIDIWATADGFRYAYIEASGDFSISVCIITPFEASTAIYAKTGLMVRQNSTPGSAEIHQVSTWQTGCEFQWRDSQGASTAWTGVAEPAHPLSHPFWVKIRREGHTWYGYYSYDGENWEHQAAAQHDVPMTDPVLVGICLCSHEPGVLTTVDFTDFKVNDSVPFVLADAYASRTLPGGYEAGGAVDVSLSLRANPDNLPPAVTVTETIPSGLTVADPGEGVVSGANIIWNFTEADVGMKTLTYTLNVLADTTGSLEFSGDVNGADILGDKVVYPVPSAPRNLSVEMLLGAHLSWSGSREEGITGYRIYRNVNGAGWQEIAFVAGTSYIDGSVFAESTYSYKVSAVNITAAEGPLSQATDEKKIIVEIREAEDFNYGGGLYPWKPGVTIAAVEASAQDDLDAGNDFWHPNKGGPKDYRPLDDVGIWDMPVYGVPSRGIGWIRPGSWWRYTFDVPEPGPGDPEGGWVKLVFRVEWPWVTTFAVYWDQSLVGTLTFTTGAWQVFTDLPLEQFQSIPGLHTLRVESTGDDPNSDALDFDKIGIGFNWTPPKREPIFEADFEKYTEDDLYGFDALVGDQWEVFNGSGEADVGWRLWNTAGDYLGDETEDRDPAIAGMTGNYVISDSDLVSTAELDEELITPDIDCTEYIRLKLDFSKNFRVYPDDTDHNQIAEVDIREVGGDWVNLLSYNVDSIDPSLDPAVDSTPEKLDLSAYDGATFQLRWHFYDASWDWWWAIDNIMVSGEKKEEPPPPKGVILSVGIAAGKLSVTWSVFGTESYYIDYTADLTGAWSEVAGPLTGTSSSDVAISGSAGFYRVRAE